MNKAAIKLYEQVFCGLKFPAYLGKYQGVPELDCMIEVTVLFYFGPLSASQEPLQDDLSS